jgi:PKD repeat protein
MKSKIYFGLLICFLFCIKTNFSNAQCFANFNYTVNANGAVNFVATCSPVNSITTQYYWNFGNNQTFTATGSPIASTTYSANGTYTVNLFFLTTPSCSNAVSILININNVNTPTCNINANFVSSQLGNGAVSFSSTSTGTNAGTIYSWNFGDSSPNGTGSAVTHSYSANGTYNVLLFAYNNSPLGCNDSLMVPITVNSLPCSLNAGFNFTQGNNGQVNFVSTSTGTTAGTLYNWKFGDATTANGNPTSHTYSVNSTYVATLTVINNSVTCYASVVNTIVVNSVSVSPCGLLANFNYSIGAGGTVNFSNTSIGTNPLSTYLWNFGDGFTSLAQSPSHTYSSSGLYNVLLMVNNQSNPICIDTIYQTINITGVGCVANSGFSLVPTTTAQVWNAIPMFPWNVVAATWNWGDNSSSNMLYTSHSYSASGTYSICLTVTVSCANSPSSPQATSSTCSSYFIFKTTDNSNMQMVQVNVVPPQPIITDVMQTAINPGNVLIYPNPSNGEFEISFKDIDYDKLKIGIYNVIGTEVYKNSESYHQNIIIKSSNLANGVYFIKMNFDNKEIVKKIIINN